MLGYKFDQEALLYLFILTLSVLAVYVFFSSNIGLDSSKTVEGSFEIELEKQPLAPNEISRLQVVDGETGVNGAEVRLDGLYIGETNSEGIISFQAMDEDFRVNASVDSKEVSKIVKVSDNQQGEVNEDFGGSDQKEPVSDEKDEESGGQNESKEEGSDDQEEDEDDEDDSEDSSHGIKLQEEPEANTRTRLILYNEGERVSEASIFLDGTKQGQTGSAGTFLLEVPNRREITVSTDVEDISSKTFDVIGFQEDEREKSIDLLTPSINEEFTANSGQDRTISFEFSKPESMDYALIINDEEYVQGSEGESKIIEEVDLSPGDYTWKVRGEDEGTSIYSEDRNFTIIDGAEIEIIEENTQVDGYILELSFRVKGNANEYRLSVNGQQQVQEETSYSEYYEHEFEEGGDQKIEIEALENGEVLESITRTYTTEEPPAAEINWISPKSPVDNTQPQTEFEILTDTEYDIIYQINKDGSTSEYNYWEKEQVSPSTEQHSFTPEPLPNGTHNYDITVKDQKNNEIGSLQGTFETTAERPVADIQSLTYEYEELNENETEDGEPDELHNLNIDMKAYEDLEYTIEVDGRTPVQNKEFTGSDLSTSEHMGDLTSGNQYTATLNVNSLETSKNLEEQLTFTAQ